MQKVVNIVEAKKTLNQLVEEVNVESRLITIMNPKGIDAVLLSEENWKNIQETLYLYSIPGFMESVQEASNEPLDEGTIYHSSLEL